jgi:hypothetical protein
VPRSKTKTPPDSPWKTCLLAVEITSPRTSSEPVDRNRKRREHAEVGVPQYWIVDLEPDPRVLMLELPDEEARSYRVIGDVKAGDLVRTDKPFPIAFDPRTLLEVG